MRRVKPFGIIAHRGATKGARENTPEAFRKARALGVDAVEFDVRLTKDRVPVIHHNYYLDESAATRVPLFAVDATEVAELPRLSDVLAEFAGDLGLEIELKGPEADVAEIAANLLREHRASWDGFEVTSFEPAVLLRVHEQCPGLATALLFPPSEAWMHADVVAYAALERARGSRAAAVHLSAAQLGPDVVATIRAGGVDVHAHAVNDDAALRLATSLEITWVCTDQPERALAFRRTVAA